MVFQTSDETWQAYNTYGGNSLYTCAVELPARQPAAYKGAAKVSYNRPFHSADDDSGGRSWLMYAEYAMIRFLEANGYDVSYTSGLDVGTAAGGSLLTNHKVFMSVGPRRVLVRRPARQRRGRPGQGPEPRVLQRERGVLEDPLRVEHRRHQHAPTEPWSATRRRTTTAPSTRRIRPPGPGTWQDPRFSPPADGGRPQNALTGQLFVVNSGTTDIRVPAQYAKLRFWRNTAVATLPVGADAHAGPGVGTLGYEWDTEPDNGFRPAGLFDLSSTTSTTRGGVHRLRQHDQEPQGPPPTACRCTGRPAGRWCSAPAPFSGPGGSTTPTAPRRPRTCSRRR